MSRREVSSVHPIEEELILSLGGELPARRLAQVRAHLEVCWNCRTQAGQLEDTVRRFVSLRNRQIGEQEPPTPAARSRFIGWMQQQAPAAHRAPAPFHLRRLGAPAFAIAFAALVLAAVIPFYLSHPPTVVSANELIERAMASETGRPALRRVRIRTSRSETVREVRTHPGSDPGRAEAVSLRSGGSPDDEVANLFRDAGLDLENPLSAVSFERWRAGLATHSDEVTQGKSTFTLETRSPAGVIRQASLTVQISDFRPIEERVHLQDGGDIRISELSYQSLPETPVAGPVPAPAVAKSMTLPPPASPAPAETLVAAGPDDSDLANAEVQLRKELHSRGLDTGFDWRIERTDKAVILSGDPETMPWIAGLPRVEYRAVSANTGPPGPATLITPAAPSQARRRAPLRLYLEKSFPAESDREQYVAQALDASQQLLAEAYALRRVAERYSPEEIALLSSDSQTSLESLIQDYVAALRQYATPASQLLAANGGNPSRDAEVLPDDWREAALRAFRAAQGVQERITWLLTEGPATEDQAPALLREMAAHQAQLGAAVDALAGRTTSGFLQMEGRRE